MLDVHRNCMRNRVIPAAQRTCDFQIGSKRNHEQLVHGSQWSGLRMFESFLADDPERRFLLLQMPDPTNTQPQPLSASFLSAILGPNFDICHANSIQKPSVPGLFCTLE